MQLVYQDTLALPMTLGLPSLSLNTYWATYFIGIMLAFVLVERQWVHSPRKTPVQSVSTKEAVRQG